ncbi:hypothetical protein H5410_038482 [Solanum commersonii]|uniref:AN1-type domain-containing protein n=1 Tax=Solanum commersonii TaxID=4109 RepID=A0A9J5YAT0_SOLCO|nr:hypothetical protein H5410_038482 [Solanum commersonii]
MFCSVHRYPEEHACTFNYKATGRVTSAKENPPCRRDKLETRIYDIGEKYNNLFSSDFVEKN